MSNTIKAIVQNLIRLAVLWLVDALSLAAAAWILSGLTFSVVDLTPRWVVIVAAAGLLAIVNLLIRPVVLLLARPLGWVALLVVGFLVNALALWITAWLLPGFEVSFWAGILGGIVIAFFNAILTGILEVDEEGSWYQNRIQRLARQQPFEQAGEGRGLMMVEIDGLSYWHLRQALDQGLLPTLQAMLAEDGYRLSQVDCGLPSMTSACQAGIMFGDNYDIPAYRWYNKAKQKLYVSASDATELNRRYARGQGLMRQGSSIMNMLNGDAEKSMFTMANMFEADEQEKKRRADDVALLMLDPYFLTRALALFLAEVVRELWEAWQQKRKDVQPRLNRMAHGYPFLRAAMCALMRDISTNLAILDMMRGAPAIYMLYLGYDEVAHHSGPWTNDAFGDLKRLDQTFARLRRVIKEKAPRPYDLIVLSDHGQSFGPTFKQRYGLTIKELIEQHMPQGTTVSQAIGGDTGANGLHSVAGELANVQQSHSGNAFSQIVAQQGQKLAERGAGAADEPVEEQAAEASVTAYGSGNAAQVYFDLYPRKIKFSELEAAYPGLIEAVVQHEGIGMVLGYEEDGSVVVLGKEGRRNLDTGQVAGMDPVIPYARQSGPGAGSIQKRVWQLKRVMEFPSAGDLWLISTLYPDGTVAALEELIGSHGGLGGEQTDAFILHPADLEVPDTRNSTDVYHLLNNHRGAPVVEKPVQATEEIADWGLSTMRTGLGRLTTWLELALRCLFLDRQAYRAVAEDPYMTGPALLIGLVMVSLESIARAGALDLVRLGGDIGLWFGAVFILYLAGLALTRQGSFTKTFRAVGFAQSVKVIAILAFFPLLAPLVRGFGLVLGFLAIWMAAATAHQTRGWRTLLLPVVAYLVLVAGTVAAAILLAGADFTLQGVLYSLGILPSSQ